MVCFFTAPAINNNNKMRNLAGELNDMKYRRRSVGGNRLVEKRMSIYEPNEYLKDVSTGNGLQRGRPMTIYDDGRSMLNSHNTTTFSQYFGNNSTPSSKKFGHLSTMEDCCPKKSSKNSLLNFLRRTGSKKSPPREVYTRRAESPFALNDENINIICRFLFCLLLFIINFLFFHFLVLFPAIMSWYYYWHYGLVFSVS